MKKFVLFLVILSLSACAAGKQLTREETLALYADNEKARIKDYRGFSKEQLIKAAETALYSFEDDYVFTHKPDGFLATRHWMLYMVLAFAAGSHTWEVTVSDTGEAFRVDSKAWIGSSTVAAPLPITSDGTSKDNYIVSPGMYKLFYSRLDYVLGLTDQYITCKEGEKLFANPSGVAQGFDPLCTMGKDVKPQQISANNAAKPAE